MPSDDHTRPFWSGSDAPESKDEPPWGEPEVWVQTNRDLDLAIRENRSGLDRAFEAAQEVRRAMEYLIPIWDDLCSATYPHCDNNCCTAQRVWFELRDLLLFHLLELEIPPGQTRIKLSDPCRYLSPRGCSLPRMTRPWRCSWYLCQAQLDLLSTQPPKAQRRFSRTLNAILENRAIIMESFRAP